MRILFPSPAEVRFIRIMNGIVLTVPAIRSFKTGFPLAIVLSMGKLRREGIQREVRVGAKFLDFATCGLRYKKGIDVDGEQYHRDILKEMERDEYLQERGWSVIHILARRLWREPEKVREDVLRFLKS